MMPAVPPRPPGGRGVASRRSTRSPEGGWRISVFVAVATVFTVVIGSLTLAELIPLIRYFGGIEGCLTFVMFGGAVVEYVGWRANGLFENGDNAVLELCLTAQLVVLAVIVPLVLCLPIEEFTVLLFTVSYVVLAGVRFWLYLRCIGAKHREEATSVQQMQPTGEHADVAAGGDHEVPPPAESGDHKVPPPGDSTFAVLVSALTYTKQIWAIGMVLVTLALGVGVTTAGQAAMTGDWSAAPSVREVEEARERKAKALAAKEAEAKRVREARARAEAIVAAEARAETERERREAERQESNAGATQPQEAEGEEEEPNPCGPIEHIEGASAQVVAEIEEHFRVSPIDSHVLGCPHRIDHALTSGATTYWADGFVKGDPHPMSLIAIPPRGYSSFEVLWPAVPQVESLFKQGLLITAPRQFPRYYAGSGSFILLYSQSGSFMFEQETLHYKHEAVPFVELPPSAAEAVASTYKEDGWLWVLPPKFAKDGEEVFELIEPSTGELVEKIYYNPASRESHRGPEWWPYPAQQKNLEVGALLKRRPSISPGEERFEENLVTAED
jgi:hypothetical protein